MSKNKKDIKVQKIHIKAGDTVVVLSGDNKGDQGKVLSIDRRKYRAIVEGVNIVTKHKKPVADETEGGRIEQEAPVHISNLMLLDNAGQATRIGRRRDDNGKIVRYSKKSGETI